MLNRKRRWLLTSRITRAFDCRDCSRELIRVGPRGRQAARLRLRPQQALHRGRDLCEMCYLRRVRAGTLDEVPRVNHRAAELLAQRDDLLEVGVPAVDIPGMLGVTPDLIYMAERRLKKLREMIEDDEIEEE